MLMYDLEVSLTKEDEEDRKKKTELHVLAMLLRPYK